MHVLTLLRALQSRPGFMLRSLVTALIVAPACNALDAPGPKGSVVVIPTDVREAQLTAAPPVPISGGTLAVSSDGKLAVAADPDRDRVSVVDLNSQNQQHIALSPGDEPGRVALDDSGRAFVALRRGGALAVIDLARGALQQRLPVCAAPRGIVFDAAQQLMHVACMDGRLVSVELQPSAAELKVVRDVQVGLDLRDVVLRGQELWVSSFKHVELMHIGADGQVVERVAPTAFSLSNVGRDPSNPPTRIMQPHLAYRSMSDASGNLLVLHQAESTEEVAIDQPDRDQNSSPYGGAAPCSGIVTPAVTTVDAQGRLATFALDSGVLSVDMASSPSSGMTLVVQSGAVDPGAPHRETFFDSDEPVVAVPASPSSFRGPPLVGGGTSVGTGTRMTLVPMSTKGGNCGFGASFPIDGQSTAVAFRPRPSETAQPATVQTRPAAAPPMSAEGASALLSSPAQELTSWVVQSREPARLTLVTFTGSAVTDLTPIDLGGDSVRDTGHDLFHLDAGSGVACASCHAEGGEDGHVWSFTRLGLRRTQALHVGLEGTAPFHWAGDESDLNHLMSDVFVGRMGGVFQSESRVAALTRWLFALQPPAAPLVADTSAVVRGQALFVSPEAGCSSCHSGPKLTNNRTVDVGTGEALQVPSLRGIAYRAPFMHNGCAQTLRDRFNPTCGGKAHGNTGDLLPGQLDDLLAYLQTL